MCPTLATTTSAMNGLWMGLSTLAVSDVFKPCDFHLRKVIPENEITRRNRSSGFLVTIVQLLIQAYVPFHMKALGICSTYLPWWQTVILGRGSGVPMHSLTDRCCFPSVTDSGWDSASPFALVIIGSVCELIGSGVVFSISKSFQAYHISIFVFGTGGFPCFSDALAMLTAIQNKLRLLRNEWRRSAEWICMWRKLHGLFLGLKTEAAASAIAKTAGSSVCSCKAWSCYGWKNLR